MTTNRILKATGAGSIGVASAGLAIFLSMAEFLGPSRDLGLAYRLGYIVLLAAGVILLFSRNWYVKLGYFTGLLSYCSLLEYAVYHQWSFIATLYKVFWIVLAISLFYLAWRALLYFGLYYRDLFAQRSRHPKL